MADAPPFEGAPSGFGNTSANGTTIPLGGSGAARPLYLKLLLDKNQGFVLEVLDAQGSCQQSITLDGVTLTTSVRGPGGVSTITQTAERIAINAKDVTIDADSVRISSRAATHLESLGYTTLSSMSDISMQTPSRISQQAMTGVDINTLSMAVSALQDVAIQSVGGVGIFGIGGGVQLFGSTVSLTGIETSVIGLVLGLLAFDLTIGAPSGGSASGSEGGSGAGGQGEGSSGSQTGNGGG